MKKRAKTSKLLKSRALEAIEAARKWLPAQPPISVFVHHNTLHQFEDLEFEDAVEFVGKERNVRPYLSHGKYLKFLRQKRLTENDLAEVVREYILKKEQVSLINDFTAPDELLLAILHVECEPCNEAKLRWMLEEEGLAKTTYTWASERFRARYEQPTANSPRPPLELLWHVLMGLAVNTSLITIQDEREKPSQAHYSPVETALISVVSSYLDQDPTAMPLPGKAGGFLAACRQISLGKNLGKVGTDSLELVVLQLQRLNIQPADWPTYVRAQLLRLPGWAGAMSLADSRRDLTGRKSPGSDLADFLAVSLSLKPNPNNANFENAALALETDRSNGLDVTMLLQVFRVLQMLGVDAETLSQHGRRGIDSLARSLSQVDDFVRRRLLHQAYEKNYLYQLTDAVLANRALNAQQMNEKLKPLFQALFCIDDREESIRRYLEDVEPRCQTFAFAGFYGLDMHYHDHRTKHPQPLCPGNMTPSQEIHEVAMDSDNGPSRLDAYFTLRRKLHLWTMSLRGGTAVAAGTGFFAGVPLVTMMFPRTFRTFLDRLHVSLHGKRRTQIVFERPEQGETQGSTIVGYSISEMTDRVETVLSSIGLTSNFARLVAIMGHGSMSLNNPHKSAYDCGACGGRRGGPNGRTFALMANHPQVRKSLVDRGISIPADTVFVGGMHDTCSDEMLVFDEELVPPSHAAEMALVRRTFDSARVLDAHERCRRFENAAHLDPDRALLHVEGRCHDLREPRPEYGHAGNAGCIIGRRALTHGLFLDRRVFLTSYDPTIDPDGKILAGLLASAVPVCAGISLEYFFSFVDNQHYGSGNKLPHNVTGLYGVMDGYASDNRTGLPWQMVEIHEPVRLVTLVETKTDLVVKILSENPSLQRLVHNRWILFGVIDPDTGFTQWLSNDGFTSHVPRNTQLKRGKSARDHYQGRSDHLHPIKVEGGIHSHA